MKKFAALVLVSLLVGCASEAVPMYPDAPSTDDRVLVIIDASDAQQPEASTEDASPEAVADAPIVEDATTEASADVILREDVSDGGDATACPSGESPTVGPVSPTSAMGAGETTFVASYLGHAEIAECQLVEHDILYGLMALSGGTASIALALPAGTHVLAAQCRDVCGNWGYGPQTTVVVGDPDAADASADATADVTGDSASDVGVTIGTPGMPIPSVAVMIYIEPSFRTLHPESGEVMDVMLIGVSHDNYHCEISPGRMTPDGTAQALGSGNFLCVLYQQPMTEVFRFQAIVTFASAVPGGSPFSVYSIEGGSTDPVLCRRPTGIDVFVTRCIGNVDGGVGTCVNVGSTHEDPFLATYIEPSDSRTVNVCFHEAPPLP